MYKDAHIAVVGLGKSGLAAIAALHELGAQVAAFDASEAQLDAARSAGAHSVQAFADPQELALAVQNSGCGLVVIAPGISQLHPLFTATKNLEIISEVELAWRIQQADAARRDRPWLDITGTNGKTTTVGMTAAIVSAAGMRCPAVGNVGTPIVTTVMEGNYDALAVELSSFQLYTTTSVSPYASVCLNIDSDHLDWHGDAREYWKAKARVYENTQRACLFPVMDQQVLQMVEEADVVEGARAIGLNLYAPAISQVGMVDDLIVDRAFHTRRHSEGIELATLADLPNRALPTLMDALAAAALARSLDVPPAAVAAGLRNFQPAAHRHVKVTEYLDVTWIDDSKATNAHAAAAALAGQPPRSVVWIAGGDTKGQNFDALIKRIEPCLRGVVLIGVHVDALQSALTKYAPQVPVQRLEPHEGIMESAIHEAVALSRPGDQVILAPACASWDQFKNYAERGEQFAAILYRLQAQARAEANAADTEASAAGAGSSSSVTESN